MCVAELGCSFEKGKAAHPSLVNTRFTVMASNVVEFILGLLVVRRKRNRLRDKVLLSDRVFARFDGNGGGEGRVHLIPVVALLLWLRGRVRHWRGNVLGEDEVVEIHGIRVVDVLL